MVLKLPIKVLLEALREALGRDNLTKPARLHTPPPPTLRPSPSSAHVQGEEEDSFRLVGGLKVVILKSFMPFPTQITVGK